MQHKKKPPDINQEAFSIWCHSVPTFRYGKQTLIPFYKNWYYSGWRYRMTKSFSFINEGKRGSSYFNLKSYLFLSHQLTQINQSVAHTTQCCVNTTICCSGYFFKAHICIVTQYNNFPLIFR